MLIFTLPALAADLTLEEVRANRDAMVAAFDAGDWSAIEALHGPKGLGMWAGWKHEAWPMFHNQARLRSTCVYSELEAKEDGRWSVREKCAGSNLVVTFVEGENGWLRAGGGGDYFNSEESTRAQDAWTVAGPPLPDVEAPVLPVSVPWSKPFLWRMKRMNDAEYAMVGTLDDCASIAALSASTASDGANSHIWVEADDVRYAFKFREHEGRCQIQVTWDIPRGVTYGLPYACDTKECREDRGQPLQDPKSSLTVVEAGKKRELLSWRPSPGSKTVRQAREVWIPEVTTEGTVARLLPAADDPRFAKRVLAYTLTNQVAADGGVSVTEGDRVVKDVAADARSAVERQEKKRTGTTWPSYRAVDGGLRAQGAFDCSVFQVPALPTKPVGPGASWTEVTVEIPFDYAVEVTRKHRLVAVDATSLSFESEIDVRTGRWSTVYTCAAKGTYTVDRSTLALVGDFDSQVTIEVREEGLLDGSGSAKLRRRVGISQLGD